MVRGAPPGTVREHQPRGVRSGAAAGLVLIDGSLMEFRARRSLAEVSGEHRLLIAVLDDALLAYCGRATTPRKSYSRALLQRDAVEWFASNDTSWPFSFVRICEELGLSVEAVREQLARVRAEYRGSSRQRSRQGKITEEVAA